MYNIEDYVKSAYESAVKRGFHETPTELGTQLALVHTEVTEVLGATTKEHVAEEFADIIIRIFDLCGHQGIQLEKAYEAFLGITTLDEAIQCATKEGVALNELNLVCLHLHTILTEVMETYRLELSTEEKELLLAEKLMNVCQFVYASCEALHLDVKSAILAKMEKNKNRPHKHGKII